MTHYAVHVHFVVTYTNVMFFIFRMICHSLRHCIIDQHAKSEIKVRADLIALAIMLGVASNADGQSFRPATEVEAHAAYCQQVARAQLDVVDKGGLPAAWQELAKYPDTASQANRDLGAVADLRSRLYRLSAYLLHRVFEVDPVELLAAKNMAMHDLSTMIDAQKKGFTETDAPSRVKSCSDLAWLPFG